MGLLIIISQLLLAYFEDPISNPSSCIGFKVKAEVNKMYKLLEIDIDGELRTLEKTF